MRSWERPPEQTRAERFASTGGCNSLPFPAEQFPRLLGRFLHQEAHLRMRRFEVGSNPVPLQFFRCCWPYRSHDCAAKPESHRLLQFHLRGNFELDTPYSCTATRAPRKRNSSRDAASSSASSSSRQVFGSDAVMAAVIPSSRKAATGLGPRATTFTRCKAAMYSSRW